MIKTLNSLRFILILMIMICHSSLPISDGMKAYLGECPVAIFFVISGFVLSLSYGERLQSEEVSNKKFFLSRVFKIYPLHLLIIAILLPMDWRLGQLKPWYQVLAHATLLQCWLPTHSFVAALNGATWFISDIIFFYLVFKWLYCWIKSKSWLQVISVMGIYMGGVCLFDAYGKRRLFGRLHLLVPSIPHCRFQFGYLALSFLSNAKKQKMDKSYHHLLRKCNKQYYGYIIGSDDDRLMSVVCSRQSQFSLCCPLLVAFHDCGVLCCSLR